MIKLNSIVLGCARFSGVYGINSKKNIKLNSIKKILTNNKKIRHIDTAINYKNANKKLKKINLKKYKVSSKIPFYNLSKPLVEEKIYKDISSHKSNLKINNFEILYLHAPKMILSKKRDKIIKILKKLKSEKITKKIGLSVYTPSELNSLLKIFTPDVVQVPLNIFDRRFLEKKLINKLKKIRIEIYFRSIFLQGILLKNFNDLPEYFKKWKKIFKKWEDWLKVKKLSRVEGSLSVLNLVSCKSNLIIGVESNTQSNEIIKSINSKHMPPFNLRYNKENLINPSKWRVN